MRRTFPPCLPLLCVMDEDRARRPIPRSGRRRENLHDSPPGLTGRVTPSAGSIRSLAGVLSAAKSPIRALAGSGLSHGVALPTQEKEPEMNERESVSFVDGRMTRGRRHRSRGGERPRLGHAVPGHSNARPRLGNAITSYGSERPRLGSAITSHGSERPRLGSGITSYGSERPRLGSAITSHGNARPRLGSGITSHGNARPRLGNALPSHVDA